MEFEWDDNKAKTNLEKHGVSFPYASRVFLDPLGIERETIEYYEGEDRYQVIGMVEKHVLVVVFTYRNEKIRIISARKATRYEEQEYHKFYS